MNPSDPLVSIVIPCYKGARYLPEAIESCLAQTYRAIEVIVVDDASPDECHAIAARYARADPRVRAVRREQNGGVARAFNTGFHQAGGEFHTRLAQDDRFKPTAIADLVAHLRARPGHGLAYANVETIDGTGRVLRQRRLPAPEDALFWGNGLGVCVLWRRAVWLEAGEFDPRFDASEDFEYWARAARRFAITKVDGYLLDFRVHEAMGSAVFSEKQERASLAVRRRQLAETALCASGRWKLRRSLSHCYYSFSSDHSDRGNQWGALRRVAYSLLLWPFPYPRDRVPARLARLKRLGVILARLLGVKRAQVGRAGE